MNTKKVKFKNNIVSADLFSLFYSIKQTFNNTYRIDMFIKSYQKLVSQT